jgi:hypothetical protein
MKDKQIEEMAEFLYNNRPWPELWEEDAQDIAKVLCSAGYRKASDVAREILREVDNALHDMAMEYLAAGHRNYFAVCEVVHHKVVRPIEKKYESEGEG